MRPSKCFLGLVGCALLLACSASKPAASPGDRIRQLREQAADSEDGQAVARWMLGELLSQGGSADAVKRARKRLDELKAHGLYADLARGLDDQFHGRLQHAPDHYLSVVKAAYGSADPQAQLIGWFAALSAVQLRDASSGLWERWGQFVEASLHKPGNLGWRTRDTLLDWWVTESWRQAERDLEERARARYGCVEQLRIAGPFGNNVGSDTYRHFPAEAPGPWPARWPRQLTEISNPKILRSKREGCSVKVDEPTADGVFYVETYLQLDQPSDLLLVAPDAFALWIDDRLALERDIREWGAGLRLGTRQSLPAGRHRVVFRTASKDVTLRVLHPDGTPFALNSSVDAGPAYSVDSGRTLADPNLLTEFVQRGDVASVSDDVRRFCAAYLAQHDHHSDVASALHEALVKRPEIATGPALHTASLYVESDPLFDRSQTSDLMRELNQRALKKDPELWAAELDLVSRTASSKGLSEAVAALSALAKRFPHVPGIGLALANVYGQLGWRVEYARTVKALAEQFPDSPEALHAAVSVYEEQGDRVSVDRLTQAIKQLEPDSEILLTQALEREDYETALSELRALQARRPENTSFKGRIDDLLIRMGRKTETVDRLRELLGRNPRDGDLHLALADLQFARGENGALRQALASAVEAGADQSGLVEAIDMVEGVTELQPYRLDAEQIIATYEKAGKHLAGTAARVLDYAVVWVRADGSSRMLEHEIIRIQSAEAISRFAEQQLDGLILNMRVIKQDGRKLEPEPVAGKPTVTFPHLEVGDYLETEQLHFFRGDPSGRQYSGPRWFFREENVAYARSELVVISPLHRELQIETHGDVPDPELTQDGQFVARRWRVDHSPAAPDEPFSAPITEFLPSVNVGWGNSLERNLAALNDRVGETIPVDPRIAKIARFIVEDIPRSAQRDRARALFRWVQANVSDGEENDGRRVVVGKSGNRWQAMITLCRALGIGSHFVVAKNRLASPDPGPISEAREYGSAVLRLDTEKGPAWITVDDKYAPFGYLPAELRSMPGFELGAERPRAVVLPDEGAQDNITFDADIELERSGAATVILEQTFRGKSAVKLRQGLAELPENRLHDVIETQLLGRALHGARLHEFQIRNQNQPDAPLVIEMQASVPAFAQPRGTTLVLSPPYVLNLSQLATLPTRQTPLLIGEATHQIVRLRIQPPKSAKVSTAKAVRLQQDGRLVNVDDQVRAGQLVLQREVLVPAGRIQPEAYPSFVQFAREADEAQARDIVIELGK